MGRRRNWLVLAASLAAHVALLAAWLNTRPDSAPVQPPAMEIQLVRLPPPASRPKPPPAPPQRRAGRPDEPGPAAPAPKAPPKPPPPVAPGLLTDPELLAGFRADARQIRDAPISGSGSWDRAMRPPRPKCKPAEGYPGPPLPCPGEIVKDPNRPFDVDRDAPDSELARAGRYKRAMKAYHEAPGGAGYPGIACAMFHQC